VSFDAEAHRRESLDSWEAAAPGWVRRQVLLRTFAAPVSHWLIDALALQPGERVLELAAGLAETGLLAAELVAPAGEVIISDQAEAMLEGARSRAAELGIANVAFKAMNAESIDLPVASVDAVLCRWGYMLMADPAAALAETRRVLSPGGRVALAVWDGPEHNPWASLPVRELIERGIVPLPARDGTYRPGMFALASSERLGAMLEDAGFTEVRVEPLELVRTDASFDELWESTLDISPTFHETILNRPAAEIEEIRAAIAERFAPFAAADGSLQVPARTLVASAAA